MADFATEASITLSIPSGEIQDARSKIEEGLSDISLAFDSGASSQAISDGSGGGVAGASGRQMRRWERQRTEDINDILQILQNAGENLGGMSGGGGGGGGGILGAIPGGGLLRSAGGTIGTLIGGTALTSLVTKSSLASLLTKAPAFATLVKSADLAGELVTGKLTAKDLIQAPIEVGDMVTFGLLDNKAVEAAIGTVTLAIGTYQIGSIVAGTLSGSALAGYFGSFSIGSILSGLGSGTLATYLGSTSVGSVLTGLSGSAALAGLLGTVGIGSLVVGTLALDQFIGKGFTMFNQGPSTPFSEIRNIPNTRRPRPGRPGEVSGGGGGGGGTAIENTPQNRERIRQLARQGDQDAIAWLKQQGLEVPGGGSGNETTVNSRVDVNVEQSADTREVVDEAVRRVENEVLPEFRRELTRSLQ